MSYAKIGQFGSSSSSLSNPLSYCAVSQLDSSFNHTLGRLNGPDSGKCQAFMAGYCANKWDGVCEYMSHNQTRHYPNTVQQCNSGGGSCQGGGLGNALSRGELLIRNTAQEKYMKAMPTNFERKYEPFDPTVADSPLIGKWVPTGNSCGSGLCNAGENIYAPIYDVDPKTIDSDPVMQKLLANPKIAPDILLNIYNTNKNLGTLDKLQGTKLYGMFSSPGFQAMANPSS